MSVSEALTVAFVCLLAGCYVYLVAKVWRGESQLDPSSPPAFWPFSIALWRGVSRAFVIQGLCVILLIGGGVGGDVVGEDSAGYNWVMGVGLVGLLGLFLLAFPITFFNRPKFLVPPHQREEPGALAEWRRDRARRSSRKR
jgi:hypothetical protein